MNIKKTALLFLAVAVAGFLLYKVPIVPEEKPYKVIIPDKGYISGTKIYLYINPPPGFPDEVILEQKELTSSSSVNTPDGKKQITVSYLSNKSLTDVAEIYRSGLSQINWDVISKLVSKGVIIIEATKGSDNVLITLSPGVSVQAGSSMVTFQYDQ